ncbi:MAG: cobalamin-binding protein [Bradymonadia bacterium]
MLTRPSGPSRIVCLTEEPTEILYALGCGDRIVGISAYTVRPPEARQTKPVVSAFLDGSVRKICALNPDLVIGFSDIQADLAKRLIAANLNVLIFNQRSVSEILTVIDHIGAMVHRHAQAQVLIDTYRSRLDVISKSARQFPFNPKVYFEEWDEPTITAIQWVSELIEIAGGVNVFSDRAEGKLAKDRFVSTEEVVASAPDIVLASWCGKPFDRPAFESRFSTSKLPAQRHEAIYEIPAEIILQPGPAALTDGVDMLHHLIKSYAYR